MTTASIMLAVYTTYPLYDGRVFASSRHLSRFLKSCSLIGITLPYTEERLASLSKELIAMNRIKRGLGIVYYQATFGAYPERGRSHILPAEIMPRLVIFTQTFDPFPSHYFTKGMKVKAIKDERWHRCHVKSVGLLPNVMDLNVANREGFNEVIWYDESTKEVNECATANVFCVKDGIVWTSPLCNRILPGITRGDVVELCNLNSILIKEERFTLDFLLGADEVFLTCTLEEVVPIYQVGEHVVKQSPGPVTSQIMILYMNLVEHELGHGFVHPRLELVRGN